MGKLFDMGAERIIFGFCGVLALKLQLASGSGIDLDLSRSSLLEVPAAPGQGVIMGGLRLPYNAIEELGPRSFANYSALTLLDLSYNPLKIINDGTFEPLNNLEYLYLEEDELVQLPSAFGPSTTTLKALNLWQGTRNKYLLNYPFLAAFVNLEYLSMGGRCCNLKIGNGSVLPHTQNDIHLKIKYTNVNYFPLLSTYMPNIEVVQITYNVIKTLSDEAVQRLVNLR